MKTCAKCKRELPSGEFYKCNDRKSGIQSICKQCHKLHPSRSKEARQVERRQIWERVGKTYKTREERRMETVERKRLIVEKRKERLVIIPKWKQWLIVHYPQITQEVNTLKILEKNHKKTYDKYCCIKVNEKYWNNPGAERKRKVIYRAKNPDKYKKWGDTRLRRIAEQSDGTVTKEAIQSLLLNSTICSYCGLKMTDVDKSTDHVIPISKGGLHSIGNITVCHKYCNVRKGAKTVEEYRERKGTSTAIFLAGNGEAR